MKYWGGGGWDDAFEGFSGFLFPLLSSSSLDESLSGSTSPAEPNLNLKEGKLNLNFSLDSGSSPLNPKAMTRGKEVSGREMEIAEESPSHSMGSVTILLDESLAIGRE